MSVAGQSDETAAFGPDGRALNKKAEKKKREEARRIAAVEAELADIEAEEVKLRERRRKLQKTFK